jgi:hypothetical protein
MIMEITTNQLIDLLEEKEFRAEVKAINTIRVLIGDNLEENESFIYIKHNTINKKLDEYKKTLSDRYTKWADDL